MGEIVGKWTLICPNQGVYEGECTYRKEGQALIVTCPEGVEEVQPGCQGVVDPGDNPNPGLKRREQKCTWREEHVEDKENFAPESFRTLCPECPEARCALCPPEKACATRIIVGCPKGEWDPVAKRCKVSMRPQVILHGSPKPWKREA